MAAQGGDQAEMGMAGAEQPPRRVRHWFSQGAGRSRPLARST
jgi:hypothetical protein